MPQRNVYNVTLTAGSSSFCCPKPFFLFLPLQNSKMDSKTELSYLFNKLESWKEASLRDFSKIVNSHRSSINKGVGDLVEEVCDLKAQLSVITKERNDLLDKVDVLGGEIIELRDKLPREKSLPDHRENHDEGGLEVDRVVMEVLGIKEDYVGGTHYSSGHEQVDYENVEDPIKTDLQIPEPIQSKTVEIKAKDMKWHQDTIPFEDNNISKDHKLQRKGIIQEVSHKLNCELCPYQTPNGKPSLKLHISQMHKVNTHKCPECTFASSRKSQLKNHIEAVHDKTRKFVCTECGYAASRIYDLKNHTKNVHTTGAKKFKCEQCPYTTAYPADLKRHIRGVHENIRDRFCEDCGYATSDASTLKRHRKKCPFINR